MSGPLSDRAVYLGDGVWWQLTERQRASGVGRGLPERIRPVQPYSTSEALADAKVALARHALPTVSQGDPK